LMVCLFFALLDLFLSLKLISMWYNNLLSLKQWVSNIELIRKKVNNAKFDFLVWWFLFKPFSLINSNITKNTFYVIEWWKELANLWDNSIKIYFKIKELINKKWSDNIILTNLFFNLKDDQIEKNH
jgi:hypothetical protein